MTAGAEAPSAVLDARSPRGPLVAVLVTMRPLQWIKNVLVIAAAGAAGALGHDDVPGRITVAFVAFCLLASGIYAINDIRDAAEDRRHPRKRHRPVAAGELVPRDAVLLGAGLVASGLLLCAIVRPLLLVVAAAYVALTLSYTIVWRSVPVFDVAAVAGGFVLRAVAGGVAAPVTLSRWFVLVVTAVAVLVAAGKRRAELRRAATSGTLPRKVLQRYNEAWLRLIMVGAAAAALFAYWVWAFELPLVHGIPWRPLTAVPFTACLMRYGSLGAAGAGEAPEELLLGDRWLLAAATAWLVLFALSVHAAG